MRSTLSLAAIILCATLSVSARQLPSVGSLQPPIVGPAPQTIGPAPTLTPVVTAPLPGSVPGWGVKSEPTAAATVIATGAAVRIVAPVAAVITRDGWRAAGTVEVRATFRRAAGSAVTAEYGLVLGQRENSDYTAFLVRPDGSVAIERHLSGGVTTRLRDWFPSSALRVPRLDGSAQDALEVRVNSTSAMFAINGEDVASIPLAAGELDGGIGIHVGTSGDVTVVALAVAGETAPGMPAIAAAVVR